MILVWLKGLERAVGYLNERSLDCERRMTWVAEVEVAALLGVWIASPYYPIFPAPVARGGSVVVHRSAVTPISAVRYVPVWQ